MNSDINEARTEMVKAFLKVTDPEHYGHLQLRTMGFGWYDIFKSGMEEKEKEDGLTHQLFNPEKEWTDNRDWLVEEMKKGNMPDGETLVTNSDRLLYLEARKQFIHQVKLDFDRQLEMAKTALYNLTEHEFFWRRLTVRWLFFFPEERMKILRELTSFKWKGHIPREITSIIESAQLMLDFDFKSGREPEKHKISREECEYILDFAFSVEDDLGKLLLGMYRSDANL